VGYGSDSVGSKALRWRFVGSSWDPQPDLLPMIAGGELSFASGVNLDGSVIVGSCDSQDFATHFAALWTGSTVQNVADLLGAALPPGTLPTDYQLQAVRVSADGRTIVGIGYGPEAQDGWMARIP